MTGKPFAKGVSPNPGGRPKAAIAMAKLIREQTDSGKMLVEFALAVLQGTADSELTDGKSRRWACDWLSDRGFGKAQQYIEVTTGEGPPKVDYSVLTDDELAQLEAITAKLQLAAAVAPQEGAGDGGAVH